MSSFIRAAVTFLKEEDGHSTVEYAVQLFLITVAAISVLEAIGTRASQTFTSAGNAARSSGS